MRTRPTPRYILSEALVLRSIRYSEADGIITFLTPGYGKISAIAKGVKKINSKKGPFLDLGSKIKAHFVRGRGLYILTQVEGLSVYDRSGVGKNTFESIFEALEVVDKLIYEGQDSLLVYRRLDAFLRDLPKRGSEHIYLYSFFKDLLELSGFWSKDLESGAECLSDEDKRAFIDGVMENVLESRIRSKGMFIGV